MCYLFIFSTVQFCDIYAVLALLLFTCLSVDNTNKDVDSQNLSEDKTDKGFLYVNILPKNEDKSSLIENSKTALGTIVDLADAKTTADIGCVVKEFVVDKENNPNQEQQDNDKKEDKDKNNNQDSGNSDNAGNTEISSQDQTLEKRKSNSRNIIVPILLGVVLFVVIVVVVVTLVLKYKKKVNEFNDSGNHNEVNNDESSNNEVNNKGSSNNEVNNNGSSNNESSNNEVNSVIDLINGFKDNKGSLLKYLENNIVDKGSELSKYITKHGAEIEDFIKTLGTNDEAFIVNSAASCRLDVAAVIVFYYLSGCFKCTNKEDPSDPRFIACKLAEDLFNKKFNEAESEEKEEKIDELMKDFNNFQVFFGKLFGDGEYLEFKRLVVNFEGSCDDELSRLKGKNISENSNNKYYDY